VIILFFVLLCVKIDRNRDVSVYFFDLKFKRQFTEQIREEKKSMPEEKNDVTERKNESQGAGDIGNK